MDVLADLLNHIFFWFSLVALFLIGIKWPIH